MDATLPTYNTSEERLSIMPQPPDSCPLVDAVLTTVTTGLGETYGWKNMNEDDLREAAEYAEWRLEQIKGEIEEVREANQLIRAWGQEWKDLAKELDDHIKS